MIGHTPLYLFVSTALALPFHAYAIGTGTVPGDRQQQAMHYPASNLDEQTGNQVPDALDTIFVTRQRPDLPAPLITPPSTVSLQGDSLLDVQAQTLGATLVTIPGVQNNAFGPAAGRPEIRGQYGPRVALLNNGSQLRDVSGLSGDHAAPLEPFLADRIEVYKGPMAVLFGGNAIGGAIDVIDNRIPRRLPERAVVGRAELRGGYNAGMQGMLRLDGGQDGWAWHIDALRRTVPDLQIPDSSKDSSCSDWSQLVTSVANQTLCQVKLAYPVWIYDPQAGRYVDATPPEKQIIRDLNPSTQGELPNSEVSNNSWSIGASRIGESGYLGASVSRYDNRYGVPGFSYITYLHPQPSDIDIEQLSSRYELRAVLTPPASWIQELDAILVRNEGDDREIIDGQTQTGLRTASNELQSQLRHATWNGLGGGLGVQLVHSQLHSDGQEAYLPSVATRDYSVFLAEQWVWRGLALQAGWRRQFVDYNLDEASVRWGRGQGGLAQDTSFGLNSHSASARYTSSIGLYAQARYDLAERAPSLIELYANGNHFGILTNEQGSSRLQKERAENQELEFGYANEWLSATLTGYRTDYQDYLYLGNTGVARELPIREWRQADTRFEGMEAQLSLTWTQTAFGDFHIDMFTDQVSSTPKFTLPEDYSPFTFETSPEWDEQYFRKALDGEFLPRTPVSRHGLKLAWGLQAWRATLNAIRYDGQTDVAKSEAPSRGYTLLDARVTYHFAGASDQWQIFLEGTNLGNQQARPHNSFLRYRAPLAGRAVSTGLRWAF